MLFRVQQFLHRLTASYWFIPSMLALAGLLLAAAMIWLDQRLQITDWDHARSLLSTTSEGARTLLATIAGSSISVAGVVFSITIVVLNMASAQFGPRLLANFMYHRGTQIVLGAFGGTFIYCLIVLGSVQENGAEVFVPQLSTGLGMLLGIFSFFLLIYFIHHVSMFVQAPRVIDDVVDRLMHSVRRIFPERPHREQTNQKEKTPDQEDETLDRRLSESPATVAAPQSDYVQAIDLDGLLHFAHEHDIVLRLHARPGHFVIAGAVIASMSPPEALNDDITRAVQAALVLGAERVPTQDPEFAVHQLVEIALRALSTGVNDPFTAINCIDRIGAVLAELASRQLPSRYLRDADGRRRVITNPFTYNGIVEAAFNQIRQQANGNASVTFRLLETITALGQRDLPEPFHDALDRQLRAIGDENRDDFGNPVDRAEYLERYAAADKIMEIRRRDTT